MGVWSRGSTLRLGGEIKPLEMTGQLYGRFLLFNIWWVYFMLAAHHMQALKVPHVLSSHVVDNWLSTCLSSFAKLINHGSCNSPSRLQVSIFFLNIWWVCLKVTSVSNSLPVNMEMSNDNLMLLVIYIDTLQNFPDIICVRYLALIYVISIINYNYS